MARYRHDAAVGIHSELRNLEGAGMVDQPDPEVARDEWFELAVRPLKAENAKLREESGVWKEMYERQGATVEALTDQIKAERDQHAAEIAKLRELTSDLRTCIQCFRQFPLEPEYFASEEELQCVVCQHAACLREVREALDPFLRIYYINKQLNPPTERALRDYLAGAWPVWGDLVKLIAIIDRIQGEKK